MTGWFPFGKKKEKTPAKDVVESLADAFHTSLRITQSPEEHTRATSQPWVGGFDERYVQNNRLNGLAAGPAPTFPQPQTQLQPLPKPPKMPKPHSATGSSRTINYAHMADLASFSSVQHSDGCLRPPEARVPPRPRSDPVVPQVAESISSGPPRPASSSRGVSASHAPLSSETSTPTARRRRRASSTALSPSSNATEDKVQCSGVTKAGNRCSRLMKIGSVLAGIGDDGEGEIERFCFQHRSEVLTPTGFYSKKTDPKTWIKFEDWIPDYLSEDTRAALRVQMEKLVSKSDKEGYIYTFEIRDDSKPNYIQLKVGRAVNVVKRIDEWSKQCGSKEQVLRGYWPSGLENDDGPLMRGRVQAGPSGPWCHRLERLVQLELADLSVNAQYLHQDFPRASSGPSSGSTSPRNGRKKVPCPDCQKLHQEIFAFVRPTEGPYLGKEWEMLVKPVIEKWGGFVEAFC